MDSSVTFGRWLMTRRQGLDLTREDVANLVGCAPVTVAKIERDERRPSRQMAERLADVLRVPPEGRADFLRQARGSNADPDSPSESSERTLVTSPAVAEIEHRSDLPVSPTSFVGREEDVAKVRSLLWRTDTRLLTLTGPPGIGKTRLALQVASSMVDDFADGAQWVALVPVMDPALVASTIAHAFNLREAAGQTVEQTLLGYLRDKQLLLLLDNFEHLVSGAPILSSLMASSQGLKILATSREILRIYGEHEYRVPPLQVPTGADKGREDIQRIASVALFVQRAQAVKPDFTLNESNEALVAQICARLDGLPLAIELAAARTRLFDLAGMLARLEHKLSVLTGGPRDLPARQQTLRGAIEWSYGLLGRDEKVVFNRMSVFVGGCDLEAVEAICGHDMGPDVFEIVSSLLDKSLVQRMGEGADNRFMLLEMIREYASERLEESGESEVVKRRLAEYYVRYVEEAEPNIRGPQQTAILDKLEREHDNLRAMLAWALEQHGELAQRLAAPLWRFWNMRGYVNEGRDWLAKALAGSDKRTAARAWTSRSAGTLASNQSDYDRARVFLQEALDIYEELGEPVEIARTLNNFGLVEWAQMRVDLARDYFSRALANNRLVGEKWGIAASLSNLGMMEDTVDSRRYLQEAYGLFLELGDKSSASVTLNNLGVAAHREGNLEEAQRLWEDCVSLYREMNNRQSLGLALTNLAVVARDLGNYDEARKLNREGLALSQAIGDVRIIGQVLLRMGGMACMEGHYEKSARLFGAAHRLMSEWKVVSSPTSKKDQDLYEGKAREALGEARYDEAWREGGRLSMDEAIEIGLTKGPN